MDFVVVTHYDQKTTTVMARALRKTQRKKRNRRTRIIGFLLVAFAFLLAFVGEEGFGLPSGLRQWLDLATGVVLLVVLLLEDQINGYFVRKRILPGSQDATTLFQKDNFVSTTQVGSSIFTYDKIIGLVETREYIIFAFSKNHAQAYAKAGITGGTVEEFLTFLEGVTGLTAEKI